MKLEVGSDRLMIVRAENDVDRAFLSGWCGKMCISTWKFVIHNCVWSDGSIKSFSFGWHDGAKDARVFEKLERAWRKTVGAFVALAFAVGLATGLLLHHIAN